MVRVVSCSFMRLSCSEEDHPLFRRYYARSNRERGVKLLRCFPHCCPEHVQRCYCGTSIHVQVAFAAEVPAARQASLAVCARFEPSRVVPLWPTNLADAPGFQGEEEASQEHQRKLQPGEVVSLPASLLSAGKHHAKQTVWIRADREGEVKQKTLPQDAVLYVLNNHRFPKWLYSYDSSVTRTQREMTHHLVVYVFQLTGTRSQPGEVDATVLARQESPGFSLISYRRSGNNSSDAGCDLPALDGAPSSTFAAIDDAPAFASTPDAMEIDSVGRLSPSRPPYELECKYEAAPEHPSAFHPAQTHSTNPDTAHSDTDFWLYEARVHQSGLAEKTKHLLILWRFLGCVSLADAGVTSDVLDAQIRSHWLRAAGALRTSAGGRASQVEGVLSSFLLSLCRSAPSVPSDQPHSRNQAVVQAAAHLLLRALSSRAVQYAFQSAFALDSGGLERHQLRDRFITLVADLYDILGDLFNLGSPAVGTAFPGGDIGVPALVDEVLSLIYSQQRFSALRDEVSALLMGNRASHSQVETVEHLFRVFATHIQELIFATDSNQLVAPERSFRWAGSADTAWSPWTRRWLLEPGSIHITSIPQDRELSIEPSLVEFSRCIYEFACVDLMIRDLILDGRLREFRATPGGMSSMMPAPGGWSIGDYAASFSEQTNTLTVDLYALRDRNSAVDAYYHERARPNERLSDGTIVQCISLSLVLEEHLKVGGVPAPGVDPQDRFIFFRGVASRAIHSDNRTETSWNPHPKLDDMSTAARCVALRELHWTPELELQGGYVAVPT